MNGRQRSENRKNMKNASAAREGEVAKGKFASVIKSIRGTQIDPYDLNALRLKIGEQVVDHSRSCGHTCCT